MRYLSIILALKAAAIIFIVFFAGIGLGPDEAQYWTWSQYPDWGYYSKPPGIAWEIYLGTALFGQTEIGVRALPILIGTLIPLLMYCAALKCGLSKQAGFYAALCMALAPLGFLSSFLAITDGGMVLFWTATCSLILHSIQRKVKPNYLAVGLLIACGALFKWPIYFLWPLVLASWYWFPWMVSRTIIGGIVLSIIGLLPSVYWNATHDWATFKHVGATLSGGHSSANGNGVFNGNPLEFWGAQAALVSPVLFIMMLTALGSALMKRREVPPGVRYCAAMATALFLIATLAAFLMKIQGNWMIFAYPMAFIVLGWYASEVKAMRWFWGGIGVSVAACALVFSIPAMQTYSVPTQFKIPYKWSPFRHNVGWDSLGEVLNKAGYSSGKDFLFADKYQMVSILSFYGPEQKRAYFLNLQGTRKNQFSFWPGMDVLERGKNGFFVVTENSVSEADSQKIEGKYKDLLMPYFKRVVFLNSFPLFEAYGIPVKMAFVFRCEDYNGQQPVDPDKF